MGIHYGKGADFPTAAPLTGISGQGDTTKGPDERCELTGIANIALANDLGQCPPGEIAIGVENDWVEIFTGAHDDDADLYVTSPACAGFAFAGNDMFLNLDWDGNDDSFDNDDPCMEPPPQVELVSRLVCAIR